MQINISKTEFLVINSDDKYVINIIQEQTINQAERFNYFITVVNQRWI